MRSKLLVCALIVAVAGLTLQAQRRGRWFSDSGFDVPVDPAPLQGGGDPRRFPGDGPAAVGLLIQGQAVEVALDVGVV